MALTGPQALQARRDVVAQIFGASPATATKAEIDASIAALVVWLEANVTSAAAALAGTALASASTANKAVALSIAVKARYA